MAEDIVWPVAALNQTTEDYRGARGSYLTQDFPTDYLVYIIIRHSVVQMTEGLGQIIMAFRFMEKFGARK